MAIEELESFGDEFAIGDIAAYGWTMGGGGSGSLQTGRVAGQCMRLSNRSCSRSVTANSRYTFGFAWKISGATLGVDLLQFREGSTEHMRLRYNGDGTFTVTRAGTAVTGGGPSANQGILNGTWVYIEMDVTIADSPGGSFELRINGSAILTGSGIDTRNGGTGVCNTWYLQHNNGSGSSDFDDGYAASGTTSFQDDLRVVTQLPNSDGATLQWTPSSGSVHYAMVDENPPNGDTDYNSDATSGNIDTLGFPALGVAGDVRAVQTGIYARKDDAGVRNVTTVIRQGGTDYSGASKAMSTSYAYYRDVWEDDPDTSATWTVSGVNSAEYGYEDV